METRGLTFIGPWGTAIATGDKQYETRSWETRFRGRLLIHAGVKVDWQTWTMYCRQGYMRDDEWPVTRAILAVATLADCEPTTALHYRLFGNEKEKALGDFSPGRYAWRLEDVRALREPVPCSGALGLWRPSAETLAAVESQLSGGDHAP